MENATKALLIGAGVLLGVMILSLAVYLYSSFGGTAQIIQDRIDMGYVNQFNNRFLAFQSKNYYGSGEPENACTVYDIITVVNMANEYNEANGFKVGDSDFIAVYIGSSENDNNINKIVNDKSKSSYITGDNLNKYTKGTELTADTYGGKEQPDPSDDLSIYYKLRRYNCYCHIHDETSRISYVVFVEN